MIRDVESVYNEHINLEFRKSIPDVNHSVRGRVVYLRPLSKKIRFFDVINESIPCNSATSMMNVPRLEVIAKYPDMTLEEMSLVKQVSLGDVVEVNGWIERDSRGSFILHILKSPSIIQKWKDSNTTPFIPMPVSVPHEKPQQQSPSSGAQSTPTEGICKFWINSGTCWRYKCSYLHPPMNTTMSSKNHSKMSSESCCDDNKDVKIQSNNEEEQKQQQQQRQEDEDNSYLHIKKQWVKDRVDKRKKAFFEEMSTHETELGEVVSRQKRALLFADFLVNTFGKEFMNRGSGVLDIAGGRGSLSFELFTVRSIKCTLIEPRPLKLNRKQHQYMKHNNLTNDENIPKQIQSLFNDDFVNEPDNREFINNLSLVVAMHPDQATEPAVDFAVSKNLPWAVVPCCTFASDNPHRRIPPDNPVTNYQEFLLYLKLKHPEAKLAYLDFFGKNCVVYCNPSSTTTTTPPTTTITTA
eukprot:TRINITY_DN3190_c0_g1_i1.p1 TRINITY_DN3190_c0_g1~~TRINITY_DN3190_c0_g1_i1.p1  ORF type:complete len:467 (-),score=91.30 TRINITY_DN3190_c0_g1_i1:14-1414(-)